MKSFKQYLNEAKIDRESSHSTEILKAVNEFDKKIEAILKKHGFEKRFK